MKKFHKNQHYEFCFYILLVIIFLVNFFFANAVQSASNWDNMLHLNDPSLFERDESLSPKFKSNLDRELNARAHWLLEAHRDFYTLGLSKDGKKFFGWADFYENGSDGIAYMLDNTYKKIVKNQCDFNTLIHTIERADPKVFNNKIKAEGEFTLDCPNNDIIYGSWYQYEEKGIFISNDKSMYGIFVNNNFYKQNNFDLLGMYLLPDGTYNDITANDYFNSIELSQSFSKSYNLTNEYYVDDFLNRISLASWYYFEELKAQKESKKNTDFVSPDITKLPQNLNPSLSQPPKIKKSVTEIQKSDITMTISEIDLLRQQLHSCLSLNVGVADLRDIKPTIYIQVNPDRTVKNARVLQNEKLNDPSFRTAAEAAMRAVNNPNCSPLLLPPNKYDLWKEINFTFDFSWMFD